MRRDRPAAFKGRHFEPEIIILCVRRYLRFALSLRNLEEIMAERNVYVDHVTIWRWIQCMHRSSVGVVDTNCGTRTDRGGWMKPIFALLANGPIYIEQWTRQAKPLISCSLGSAMPLPPRASSREPYGRQTILVHESSTKIGIRRIRKRSRSSRVLENSASAAVVDLFAISTT